MIDPVEFTVIPEGSEPETSDQLYGAWPPAALKGPEYAVPATATGKDLVVMLSGVGESTVIVTDAVPDLVASATLVAITVALVLTVTVGAWYSPVLEIVPVEADQVTATFEVFVTRAVNCLVPADGTEAVAGETVTTTPGG